MAESERSSRYAALNAMVTSLAGQAALVVSGPITARLLGVDGRGQLALITIMAGISGQVGALGIPTAVVFTIAKERTTARVVLSVVGRTWLRLCLLSAAVVAGTFAVFARRPSAPGSGWVDVALIAVLVVTTMNGQLFLACLQGEHRFTPYNAVRLIPAVGNAACLAAVLVLSSHASVSAVLGVLCVTASLTAVMGASLVFARKSEGRDAPPLDAGSIVRYGAASMAGANASLESLSLDQATVGLLLTRQDLGLYAVGAAFNNLPSLLLLGLGTVALPRIAAEPDRAAQKELIKRVLLVAVGVAGAVSIGVELIVGWLLPFAFGQDFSGAVPVARVLIGAGFLLSLRRIFVVFLQALGRPGSTGVAELIGLVCLAVTAAILVPSMGLLGAGFALVAAGLGANSCLLAALRATLREPLPGDRGMMAG